MERPAGGFYQKRFGTTWGELVIDLAKFGQMDALSFLRERDGKRDKLLM
jgi:hypothetical protein